MEHRTPSTTDTQAGLSGLIYESGLNNGYAYTRIDFNAPTRTVTILYADGTRRTLDADRLGDTLPMWAARCWECRCGLWPDMRLGPVGERMARKYAVRQLALSA